MQTAMEIDNKFSSKYPENSTFYMVEGRGYLYPQFQLCFLLIAPPQLIYSSSTTGFIVIQGERCTNPTFSRVHVFHARMCIRRSWGPSHTSGFTIIDLRTSLPSAGLVHCAHAPERLFASFDSEGDPFSQRCPGRRHQIFGLV